MPKGKFQSLPFAWVEIICSDRSWSKKASRSTQTEPFACATTNGKPQKHLPISYLLTPDSRPLLPTSYFLPPSHNKKAGNPQATRHT